MPRPTTKEALLHLSQHNFQKLFDLINSFSGDAVHGHFPPQYLNRNIRDVLGHLHHWHLLFFEWYQIGMSGEKPEMPAKGYTWKTTSSLNKVIQQKYQHEGLDDVISLLNTSHLKIMQLIQQHSNDELFEKKRYQWTGTTSLGAYLVSATSSHYDWAFKLIRKYKKSIHS